MDAREKTDSWCEKYAGNCLDRLNDSTRGYFTPLLAIAGGVGMFALGHYIKGAEFPGYTGGVFAIGLGLGGLQDRRKLMNSINNP